MDTEAVKQYLAKYAGLREDIEDLENRIKLAEYEATHPAVRQSDGSQRQPGRGDRMELAIIRHLETEERWRPVINEKKAELRQIEEAIESLPNGHERTVLRRRYMDCMEWKEIAYTRFCDDDMCFVRRLQRLHDKAVEHLCVILTAKEKRKSRP